MADLPHFCAATSATRAPFPPAAGGPLCPGSLSAAGSLNNNHRAGRQYYLLLKTVPFLLFVIWSHAPPLLLPRANYIYRSASLVHIYQTDIISNIERCLSPRATISSTRTRRAPTVRRDSTFSDCGNRHCARALALLHRFFALRFGFAFA